MLESFRAEAATSSVFCYFCAGRATFLHDPLRPHARLEDPGWLPSTSQMSSERILRDPMSAFPSQCPPLFAAWWHTGHRSYALPVCLPLRRQPSLTWHPQVCGAAEVRLLQGRAEKLYLGPPHGCRDACSQL